MKRTLAHRVARFAGLPALAAACALTLAACGGDAPASTAGSGAPGADQIARGRYLVKAADCAACHTAKDGAPFAGGAKLDSPYGTFYGSNITPDKDHGIGRWSADDFYAALHDGKAPGKRLYPSMPYTSYRQLTRADTDAMYAYLMTIKPVAQANREHELKFPYNLRFGMALWDLAFLKDSLPDASTGQSADWQRGRYLAGALGHCAECHTPRAFTGQLDGAKPFAGAALGRVAAPDITPAGLAARGWTGADLQTFFGVGIAPQGSAFGEMYPVVHLSTQYLTKDDLRALSVYLLGDTPPAPQPVKPVSADAAQLAAGRSVYVAVCAGCHGLSGEGKPHVAVPMAGNSTVRQHDPRNLLVAVLDGIDEQKFAGVENMQAMPGFAGTLGDEEVAQLANYLRATWGGQPASVTPADVKAMR
ncbi:cytochrome c [Burkholderia multivorans]|uniref:cytochrome c n=1 Tax=Burkholderia multivorans TaxID=87883 RepID=UPI000F4F9A45|nr:cytochrome c [Burkholderia multivorans]AYY56443.1 cytochrome c [Burkholderia multivorans]MCA8436118.1 cytochrome c [Burkholderia multivorans]MCO8575098.1 cytochrome c [Burkholderia multivorans]MDN7652989.1 cytochrome c [Burkholderia multivorans]